MTGALVAAGVSLVLTFVIIYAWNKFTDWRD